MRFLPPTGAASRQGCVRAALNMSALNGWQRWIRDAEDLKQIKRFVKWLVLRDMAPLATEPFALHAVLVKGSGV